MSTKKYELILDNTVIVNGKKLFRIRSLIDIPSHGVVVGTIGGYVEDERNLSHSGSSWISGYATVYDNAEVSGNAYVFGNALVSGNARVSGYTRVSGYAKVYDNARVFDNARVSGYTRVYEDAEVSGNAYVIDDAYVSGNACVSESGDCITIGPALSSGIFTTAHKDKEIGIRVNTGFFSSSLEGFASAIENKHKDNQAALRQYRAFHQLFKSNFEI